MQHNLRADHAALWTSGGNFCNASLIVCTTCMSFREEPILRAAVSVKNAQESKFRGSPKSMVVKMGGYAPPTYSNKYFPCLLCAQMLTSHPHEQATFDFAP